MFSSSKVPSLDATYATHNAPFCKADGLYASLISHPWIGDLGYVEADTFVRVFNILLPADDPEQSSVLPAHFKPMDISHKYGLDIVHNLCSGPCCISGTSDRPRRLSITFESPSQPDITRLFRRDTHPCQIPTWHQYMLENVNHWHKHIEKLGLNRRLEDMVLVTGYDLTTSPNTALPIPRRYSGDTLVGVRSFGSDKDNCQLYRTERAFVRGFRMKLNSQMIGPSIVSRSSLKERDSSTFLKMIYGQKEATQKKSLALLMLNDILRNSKWTMAIVHDNDFSSFITRHRRDYQQCDERVLRAFMKDYLRSPEIKAYMHSTSKRSGHDAGFLQLRKLRAKQGR